MGYLILASIGLLVGFFLAIVPGSALNPVVGIPLMAICVIPWVSWGIKKTREQEVKQLQEQVLQTPQPQQEQPQEQPRKRQWIRDE